ncbi:site-specific DNA-methyltransferase [Flavobacterium sp. GSP14]|uniref:site-specific DNA-methyltransferase n=1 Tax=Flavobacterium sp. GSP14 TaxID=3401734 RepID=UPI003AAD3C3B
MESINDYMPLSNDWNKERLQVLKQQFPDWFTSEGSLNIDEVKKAINPDTVNETERYEFRWFGKSQAKRNAFTPSNATLVYDEARSVNPENSENLIIEGENLEVLKLLSGSYREKIKCIYIDPPYNKDKDFVYRDIWKQDTKSYWEDSEYVENGVKIDSNSETTGRYHSNWLNMMYSRLLIGRQLLSDDGAIFISIDDAEVHHLRKLCDEVFGEENFLSEIIWHSKYTTANDAKYVSRQHEYVLLYAKNKENFDIGLLDRTAKMDGAYTNPDHDERGVWKSTPLHAKSGSSTYKITFQNGVIWEAPKGRYPLYSEKDLLKLYDENRLYFGKSGVGLPNEKSFLTEVKQGKTVGSMWSYATVGSSHQANEEIASVIGKGIFDNPKTSMLIQTIIKTANCKNSIVLDFFGGSGTTGQAVMELNKDGGNRKYILVQIPEATDKKSEAYKAGYKKISDITIERNKRVVTKIENEIAENKRKKEGELSLDIETAPMVNLGFKVFKLQKSNFPRVDFAPDPELSDAENLVLLKKYIADKESQLVNAFNKEELMTEILLKNNFSLNYKTELQSQFKKNEIILAFDDEKETLICLDVSIDLDTVDYFKTSTEQKFICLERALDTTKKYNLKHYLGDKFNAF